MFSPRKGGGGVIAGTMLLALIALAALFLSGTGFDPASVVLVSRARSKNRCRRVYLNASMTGRPNNRYPSNDEYRLKAPSKRRQKTPYKLP